MLDEAPDVGQLPPPRRSPARAAGRRKLCGKTSGGGFLNHAGRAAVDRKWQSRGHVIPSSNKSAITTVGAPSWRFVRSPAQAGLPIRGQRPPPAPEVVDVDLLRAATTHHARGRPLRETIGVRERSPARSSWPAQRGLPQAWPATPRNVASSAPDRQAPVRSPRRPSAPRQPDRGQYARVAATAPCAWRAGPRLPRGALGRQSQPTPWQIKLDPVDQQPGLRRQQRRDARPAG